LSKSEWRERGALRGDGAGCLNVDDHGSHEKPQHPTAWAAFRDRKKRRRLLSAPHDLTTP
jgi:hypothetical protein